MKYHALIAWCLLAAAVAGAAEIDLYVTDYNDNPAADQRAMADRPIAYAAPKEVVIRTADGKTITIASPQKVLVQRTGLSDPREARLFASLGEYEPFSFLLRPKESLQDVFIAAGPLTGPGGATIPAECLTITSVEGYLGQGRDILMGLGRKWNMGAHHTEHFWCTVRVPADARGGAYSSKVTVTAQDKLIGEIRIVLDVLPIRLTEPPLAVGYNYSKPESPAALAAQLKDMREHGMTCVAPLYKWHLPVHDEDTAELGGLLEAYRKAGFPGTFYFATPMELQLSSLAGYGSETTRRWQQKFIQVMRRLHAETLKHDVPVLMSIGDELTNKGVEGVKIAENLARFAWEELPEIATTSDMNGYREVMAMAPYLNVATFNNGWDGIDHHNQGRRLLNRAFLQELQEKTGTIPWFVNAGTGRLPFGFFLWKMARYGVRGKVEWYYSLDNQRGSVVRAEGEKVWPTLDYERCREGIDDLKYLYALEGLAAKAKAAGKAAEQVRAAEELLKKIAESIQDDWSAYEAGGARFPADGFAVMDPEKAAGLGEFNAVRRALADRIVALQEATK